MKTSTSNINSKEKKYQKQIVVRFPTMRGDDPKTMTLQELKDNHSKCLLIDPTRGESVTIEDIDILDLREIVAMYPIRGG